MSDDELRVFISSKMRGSALQAERKAAVEAVKRYRGILAPWDWETRANAAPRPPMEQCLDAVSNSNFLILLLGHDLTENTRKEHETAVSLNIPDFIFVKQGPLKKETRDYLALHGKRSTYKVFKSIRDLKSKIAESLAAEIVRECRKGTSTHTDQTPREIPTIEKPTAGARRRARENQEWPTFEQWLRQALDALVSSLRSGDFAVACSNLATLAEGVNYADVFEVVVQLNEAMAAHADAMRSADPRSWAWFLNSLSTALSKAGRSDEAVGEANEMLALSRSLGDEELQSTALQNLGVLTYYRGEVDKATRFYMQALEIKERISDRRGQAQVLNNLASMAIEDEQFDEAELLLARSITIKRCLRSQEDMLPAYITSGNLAVARGDFRKARTCFRKALQTAESVDAAEDAALSRLNLGNVTMELGYGEEALSHYRFGLEVALNRRLVQTEELLRQAMAVGYNKLGLFSEAREAFQSLADVKRRLGKTLDEALAYHDAAVVCAHSGDSDAALQYYKRAVKGFRRAVDPEWEARSLWEMASLLAWADRPSEALPPIRRAIRVLRRNGCLDTLPEAYAAGVRILFQARSVDRAVSLFREELLFLKEDGGVPYQARRLKEVGNRLLDLDRPRRAIPFLQQSVSSYHDLSDPTSEALARNDLAMAHAALGRVDEARSEYALVLAQADRDDDRVLRLLALMNLAELQRRTGAPRTAIEMGLQSAGLAEQINDTDSLAMILNNLGLAYADIGETAKARVCFRKSVRSAEQRQDNQALARALISLGNLHLVRGQYEQALRFYEQARSATEGMNDVLAVDALESCLTCLASLDRDKEASEVADQAVEMADKIEDFERAERIAQGVALANFKKDELNDCAVALLASFGYASKRSLKSAIRNIATWAVFLSDAEHKPYGREGLYEAIVEAIERLAPDDAPALRDMLDTAVRILDEQRSGNNGSADQ